MDHLGKVVIVTSSPPEAINDRMNARRVELRLDWIEVQQLAGVSHETVRKLRNGARVTEKNERAIETALGWEAGSIARIRNGAEPIVAKEPPPAPPRRPADYPADFPDHPALWDLWQDDRLAERDRYVAILSIKGQWDLAERTSGEARSRA